MIKNLAQLIEKTGKLASKTAIIFENKKFDYYYLKNNSDKFAQALITLGISKGERVGILLRNCPEFVISLFGVIKAGAIAVPLNFMLTEEELKPIIEEAGIKVIISCRKYFDILQRLRLRIEFFQDIILIDDQQKKGFYSIINKVYPGINLPQLLPDEVAVIIYTSCTTGKPKGVMLSHQNFLANIKSALKVVSFSHRERVICLLPLFHSFALTVCLFLPLYISAPVILISRLGPFRRVFTSMIKHRVTIFVGVPPIFKLIADMKMPWYMKIPVVKKMILPLKICISGAAPLPLEVWHRFERNFGIPLLEGYGLTEASPVVSINPPYRVKPGSVGLPLPGIEVRVVNEDGTFLPPGKEGELIVKGENIMKGYYKKEEETAAVIKDGWLYTGDIARLDEEGYIYILDRKKDLIIVRGLNVYPREIEEVIYYHPKVKEVCVVGVEDKSRGEVPKAFVVVKEGEELTAKELLEFLRLRLARYKIPRYIEFRDELPKSPSGKILRKELKDKI